VIDPVRRFGVTNLFGSPALLRRVGEYGARHGVKLPTLKRVLSAGAPVPAKVIASFASMLNEDAQVFTPYGATESLPVACTGSREILGETAAMTDAGKGVCIGRPVEGIEARVIRITDDVIERWSDQLIVPPGEVGEIAVRGPQVTRAYFNRDAATRLAKIVCDDGSFWHRMGDLGYLDTSGRLWFCGRKSHRVRVAVEDGRLGGDPGHRNAPA
jgi:acyl-CoA synthetase (AMP-forming)/AMP-acid ligase II